MLQSIVYKIHSLSADLKRKFVQIKKNYTLSTFPSSYRRNFEDSGKMLAVSVSEFYQSSITVQLYQPTLVRWLSPLYVYK